MEALKKCKQMDVGKNINNQKIANNLVITRMENQFSMILKRDRIVVTKFFGIGNNSRNFQLIRLVNTQT
jgi:hypothetical protein